MLILRWRLISFLVIIRIKLLIFIKDLESQEAGVQSQQDQPTHNDYPSAKDG